MIGGEYNSMMVETKTTEDVPINPIDDEVPNICCVISDSLRWDVFNSAKPRNIKALGEVRKAHSIACSTLPSMTAYMMNYPPIGIGYGLFHQGYDRGGTHSTIREWMPRHYQERGYKTAFLTGNAVPWRLDEQTKGMFNRFFDYKPMDYLTIDVATPQIIQDLDKYVEKNKKEPIFAVCLLLDTHSPYHDGEGKCNLIDPRNPAANYYHQEKAMKFVDNVFPNFIHIFSKTEKPTHFIFTSDHGENFAGNAWGHNSFRPGLEWRPELFEIPFVRRYITDWDEVSVTRG